jgi:hypothetical protein
MAEAALLRAPHKSGACASHSGGATRESLFVEQIFGAQAAESGQVIFPFGDDA